MTEHIAHAEVEISASAQQVWEALTSPEAISRFMFGAKVDTDWEEGSPITWTGEYDGKPYQDKGEILEVVQGKRLRMTHFSPLTGESDTPENYHTLDYRVMDAGDRTRVTLEQDGNDSEEQAAQFSSNWQAMLDQLKGYVEKGPRASS
ncbi:SRPBCC family protein [Angustibacter sp. McL0619]|uniref:SRPBCC family protein n=1 Tax=Angustibacter sp. McL0619 TaxID=3415676 RepID=UPI003CE7A752